MAVAPPCTYQHEQAARLHPGAAAAEEADHKADATDAHEDRVRTEARMLRQQRCVALVAEAQPQSSAEKGATAEL